MFGIGSCNPDRGFSSVVASHADGAPRAPRPSFAEREGEHSEQAKQSVVLGAWQVLPPRIARGWTAPKLCDHRAMSDQVFCGKGVPAIPPATRPGSAPAKIFAGSAVRAGTATGIT
jgi:hypothetical protein